MIDRTIGRVLSYLRIERQQQIAIFIEPIVQFFMATVIEPKIQTLDLLLPFQAHIIGGWVGIVIRIITPLTRLVFIEVKTHHQRCRNLKSLTVIIQGILGHPTANNALRMIVSQDDTYNSIDIRDIYLTITVHIAI